MNTSAANARLPSFPELSQYDQKADSETPTLKAIHRDSYPRRGEVLVAIPVFNEARYVDSVLREVQRYAQDILVVNDGSTDGTAAVLARHRDIRLISHTRNLGYGRSLIDAFDFAAANGFDWVITIDCDHQHEPSCIPQFQKEIEKDDADIISGSRYLRLKNTGTAKPPLERIVINRKITNLLNQALGIKLTDAFCGFKAYRTQAIVKLKLSEAGYAIPLQLWVRAGRAGLIIREIPVPLIYHNPQRNFAGRLEDPQFRLRYYLDVIERELGRDVGRDLKHCFDSCKAGHGLSETPPRAVDLPAAGQ